MNRLSGLKSVSGRRVMPGDENLQELESAVPDVSGSAAPLPNFNNFIAPNANSPEPDRGGEITAQSYDVRANTVDNPPPQEEEQGGFWQSLGKNLASVFQSPQKDTQAKQGIPSDTQSPEPFAALPMLKEKFNNRTQPTPQEPNYMGPIAKGLKDYVEPFGSSDHLYGRPTPQNEQFINKAQMGMSGQTPESQQLDQEAMNKAQQNPYQIAAYGATDAFANNPELVSEFNTYTGINFDEQEKEMTQKYEKVLSDIEKGFIDNDAEYDEREKALKDRILNNQANDADKYYIGMALLMPLLIGGVFGKEAALGALGGGAKGIADVYKGREEGIRKDEETLLDIYKQKGNNSIKRGELELERVKLPSDIRKNMPKDEYEDLKGSDIYTFKDPATGNIVAEGPEVLPDLYLDLKYGGTAKKREKAGEMAVKLEEEKAALERANEATFNLAKAAMQLPKNGFFGKYLAYALSDDDNGALKKIMKQNAPMINVDGRQQNSAVYIDSMVEQMKDAYRRNEQMKSMTVTVANHIGSMVENPLYNGQRPEDLIDQLLIMRDRGQKFFIDRAGAQGFIRQPLESKFGKQNKELYKGLNKKEELIESEKDKQLMHASE